MNENDSLLFSKKISLKTDSIFNFLCTIIVITVFSPIRFTIALGRRIVFVPKDKLENILFTSVIVGVALTFVFTIVQIFSDGFSLLYGTFPTIIMIVGCVCLVGLYLLVCNSKSIIFHKEEVIKEKFHEEEKTEEISHASASGEKIDFSVNFEELDIDFEEKTPLHPIKPKEREQESEIMKEHRLYEEREMERRKALARRNERRHARESKMDEFRVGINHEMLGNEAVSRYQGRIAHGVSETAERFGSRMHYGDDKDYIRNELLSKIGERSVFEDDQFEDEEEMYSMTDFSMEDD